MQHPHLHADRGGRVVQQAIVLGDGDCHVPAAPGGTSGGGSR
jgi:hypothetical protein